MHKRLGMNHICDAKSYLNSLSNQQNFFRHLINALKNYATSTNQTRPILPYQNLTYLVIQATNITKPTLSEQT